MSPKITNIELQIGTKTIDLSVEEAKELLRVLQALFNQSVHYPWTYPYPYYPITTYQISDKPQDTTPTIMCYSTTDAEITAN